MLKNYETFENVKRTVFGIAKEDREKFVKAFISGQVTIKAVKNVPSDTVLIVRTWLGNNLAHMNYMDTLRKAFDSGEMDEDTFNSYSKSVSAQWKVKNEPLNMACNSLYNAMVSDNQDKFNEIFLDTFKFECKDFLNALKKIGTLKGNKAGALGIISKSQFNYNVLSVLCTMLEKSGVALATRKFESTYQDIVDSVLVVNKSEMYKENVVREVGHTFGIESEDYAKIADRVFKLYKKNLVIIKDDTPQENA
jgi:hypothetical protein